MPLRREPDREGGETVPSPLAELTDRLARLELFEGLDRSFVLRVASTGQLDRTYRRQTLIEEGDSGDILFLLLDGRVTVQIESIAPHIEVDINRLGAGQLIGESALFEDRPRSATVIAMEPCEVFITTAAAVRCAMEENPAQGLLFLRNVTRQLAERLREMNRRFVSMRRSRSW